MVFEVQKKLKGSRMIKNNDIQSIIDANPEVPCRTAVMKS